MTNACIIGVIYFMIFLHFLGGFTEMLRGNLIDKKILESKPVESILSGVVSIALGSLLLVGTVKKSPRIVFVYYVITTGLWTISTVAVCIIFFRFTTETPLVLALLAVIMLVWALHCFVYIFYKDLRNKQKFLEFPQTSCYVINKDIIEKSEENNANKYHSQQQIS